MWRARMERAGKLWSWRLLDDFGTHVAERGTEFYVDAERKEPIDHDVVVDGGPHFRIGPG